MPCKNRALIVDHFSAKEIQFEVRTDTDSLSAMFAIFMILSLLWSYDFLTYALYVTLYMLNFFLFFIVQLGSLSVLELFSFFIILAVICQSIALRAYLYFHSIALP